jgi:hypothetical protein
MDGHIGRLRCRFRLHGAGAGLPAGGRVDKERLAASWELAMDTMLGADPAVYVVRRAAAGLAVPAGLGSGPADLADLLGRRLAEAVARTIADDPGDGANLVRFDDQADYLARFITDLLDGRAWSVWFYGPFSGLRARSPADAALTVLLADRTHLGPALARLHRSGSLGRLLAALGPSGARLWSEGIVSSATADRDKVRPLLAAAMGLLHRLDLWAGPTPELEELLERLLPDLSPVGPWTDPATLTTTVTEAVQLLAELGLLRAPGNAPPPPPPVLDPALAELDWLDTDRLRGFLLELLAGPGRPAPALPGRPPAATPRRQELLDDLGAVLVQVGHELDPAPIRSDANALRLCAALVARAPAWAADPALPGMVDDLLVLWAWAAGAGPPAAAVAALRGARDTALAGRSGGPARPGRPRAPGPGRSGDATGQDRGTAAGHPGRRPAGADPAPEPARPGPRELSAAIAVGETGLRIVEGLVAAPAVAATRPGVESACAGVFLLLRAMLEARLAGAVRQLAVPEPGSAVPAVMLSLALRWAGPAGTDGDRLDPALGLLAGMDPSSALDRLRAFWSGIEPPAHARLQAELVRTAVGLRLLDGASLGVHRLDLGDGGVTLVASDGTPGVWPLARRLPSAAAAAATLEDWLDTWEAASGTRPEPVVADDDLTGVLGTAAPGERHRRSLDELGRAMASLEAGRLGIPEADLTVACWSVVLLRLWARWLRGFAGSSAGYLLDHFIRRPGRVVTEGTDLTVVLEPGPFDVVLELAGYGSTLDGGPIGHGHIRFALGGAP